MKLFYPLLLTIAWPFFTAAQGMRPAPFGTPSFQAGFLENCGQVRDFKNKAVNDVYFVAHIGNQQVFITRTGLSLLMARPKKVVRVPGLRKERHLNPYATPADSLSIVDYEMERTDIVLKKASISLANVVTKEDDASPMLHFYLGDKNPAGRHLRLKHEVLVENVYPGIDWRVYFQQEPGKSPRLKYDFIIHPGADPTLIQLRYSDNAQLALGGNELEAKTHMGIIREASPYTYTQETQQPVGAQYKVEKNNIRFQLEAYDKSQTLVIDPSIFWLTYLSSTSQVYHYQSIFGHDVETDKDGNIFVQLSAARGIPFPTANPGGGAYYQDYTASPDGSMIITKFAPGGQMLWSTYFGNWVGGCQMTVDKYGNIVAIGRALNGNPEHPTPNPSVPLLNNGGYYDGGQKQYFIAKFSNKGVLTWSSYYVSVNSYPMDMSYDESGNVYVTGWSTDDDFPTVDPGNGAYAVTNPQHQSEQVLFIAQFDSANKLAWSTRIEGGAYDPYARVCTDKAGNIYLGGQVRSVNYPLVDAGGYFNANAFGSVLTRFNAARKMTWSTYIPGAFSFADLTTDDSSNLYAITSTHIMKFDSHTNLIFDQTVNTTQMHFWKKINWDAHTDQIYLLGVMNDGYYGFPTINTACNGSFFNDGISFPRQFTNATGPIFAIIDHTGNFSYRSLVDWVSEYYEYNEMSIDPQGNPVYLFGYNANGYVGPNPQLTDPGNGAYFDRNCCYLSDNNSSALLLKLIPSDLSVKTETTAATGCTCNGTATVLPQCGQAPFTYLWDNGATTPSVSGLCPGTYRVKVTDAANLSTTITVTLASPPGSITAVANSIVPENCSRSNGGFTVQTVQGGTAPYTYSLDGTTYLPTPRFGGLDSGLYFLHIKDANGCTFRDSVFVPNVAGPSAMTFATTNSSCKGADGQIEIKSVQGGIGPYQYSLDNSPVNTTGLFSNLTAGTYAVTISDTAGCRLSQNIMVNQASPPVEVSFAVAPDHCGQGIGSLAVTDVTGGTAPYLFSLDSVNFSAETFNQLTSGVYSLFVKDSNGCVLKKAPVTINEQPGPASADIAITHAYCGRTTGEALVTAVQGGAPPYLYAVDGGSYASSTTLLSILPGLHTLQVKDKFGCTYSRSFTVDFLPVAKINLLPADTIVCYNEAVVLKLTGEVGQIKQSSWNVPAQGDSAVVRATDEKQVYVMATDVNNCIVKDTSIVRTKACNPPESCLAIPTAFTPNKDGKNETIGPLANGCRIASIHFEIYNRWGERVFESSALNSKWNGMYNGLPQPADVYVFYCRYVTEDGMTRQQKGTLTLIR
jgi:gliding motility-associated-like protein